LLPPGPHPFRRFAVKTAPSRRSPLVTIQHGMISFQQGKRVPPATGFTRQLLILA